MRAAQFNEALAQRVPGHSAGCRAGLAFEVAGDESRPGVSGDLGFQLSFPLC